MRISERKKRLRRRGIVPVAQEVQTSKAAVSARQQAPAKSARGPAAKGGKAAQRRQRRPLGPNYQLGIGALYVLFAPFLFLYYISLMNNPKSKVHPGALELIITLGFLAFGVWNLYLGVKGKRRQLAEKRLLAQQAERDTRSSASSASTPVKSTPVKKRRALKESSSQP